MKPNCDRTTQLIELNLVMFHNST